MMKVNPILVLWENTSYNVLFNNTPNLHNKNFIMPSPRKSTTVRNHYVTAVCLIQGWQEQTCSQHCDRLNSDWCSVFISQLNLDITSTADDTSSDCFCSWHSLTSFSCSSSTLCLLKPHLSPFSVQHRSLLTAYTSSVCELQQDL